MKKISVSRVQATLFIASLLCLCTALAGPPPIQTYLIPGTEEQIRATFLAGDSGSGSTIVNVISISPASTNTLIYYDQRENGYEADIANPVSVYSAANLAGTQIWGDNNAANGIPPGYATDLIGPGKPIVLKNEITLPVGAGQTFYDCGDKIASTKAIAVAFVLWPTDPGPVLADALGVYDTRAYGTNFIAPVGEDTLTSLPYSMFNYSALTVMAAQDGTLVRVDTNGDGTVDLTATINQGQSYMASSNGGIRAGAEVKSSKPVQVHLFTDRRNSRMQSRWFSLDARERWSTNYYTAVGTTDSSYPAGVILYNPYTNSLSVAYQTRSSSGVNTVPAKSTLLFTMPSDSGAIFTANRLFTGVNVMDVPRSGQDNNNGDSYDWGCSLQPASALTSAILVGYGAGSADYSGNGSPVWVMALNATTLYVDYDGNPATGPLVDPRGARYDTSYSVTGLQSKRIFNPSSANDQTGMRVYTVDGVKIVGAWGEDPDTASSGNPYLDAGYTIFGLPEITCSKSAQLTNDVAGNGTYDPGDGILYTLRVNNEGGGDLQQVVVKDPLPSNTTYVANSVSLNGVAIPDNTVPPSLTPYPLDEGGLSVGTMPGFSSIVILFRVKITNSLPVTVTNILNTAQVTSLSGEVTVDADVKVLQADLELTKSANRSMVLPGTNFTYTLTVLNKGPNKATNVTVRDVLPAGVAFVSAPGVYNSANGMWTIGSLNTGSSTTLQIIARTTGAGVITNAAEVWTANPGDIDSTPGNGVKAEDDYGTAILTSIAPAITVSKTVSTGAFPGSELVTGTNGTPVNYWIVTRNAGDVTLTNVTLSDTLISFSANLGTLLAGQSVTTSVPRNITADLTSPVTATGIDPLGLTRTATDTAGVDMIAPAITVSKTVSKGAFPGSELVTGTNGTPVTYWIVTRNAGDVTLTNVTLSDTLISFSANLGTLVAGQSVTTSVPRNITADLTSSVTATGIDPLGLTRTATDAAGVDMIAPAITVSKTVSKGAFPGSELVTGTNGTPVTYWIVTRNSGDVTLTNVTLSDTLISFSANLGTLVAGQSVTTSVPRNITADLTSPVTATGIDPLGLTRTATDAAGVEMIAPAITVSKTVSTGAFPGSELVTGTNGTPVTYWIVTRNSGDVTLTNVTLSDTLISYSANLGTLVAGQSVTTSVPRNITADLTSPVTAAGIDPMGLTRTATDTAGVEMIAPAITVSKTVSTGAFPGSELVTGTNGTPVNYWIVTRNAGDVTLTNVTLSDPLIAYSVNLGTLAAGRSVTTSVPRNITADLTSPVTAAGIDPLGLTRTATDTAGVDLIAPAVTVVKTAGAAADGEVLFVPKGTHVTYRYELSNTGDTYLKNVVVSDDVLGPVDLIPGPVAPGWTATLFLVHSNLTADVINIATVAATPAFSTGEAIQGVPDVADTDDAEARIVFFTLNKEDLPDPVEPAQPLSYTLWVANPSPNKVTGLLVTEQYPPLFTFVGSVPAPTTGNNVWDLGTLEPGALVPIVINGMVSSSAVAGNLLTNHVTAASSNAGTITTNEITRVTEEPRPGKTQIRVTKRDDFDPVRPGDALSYTIRVENFGPVTATNVVVTESYDPLFQFASAVPAPNAGSDNVWSVGNLAANAYAEIVVSGTVSLTATNGTVLLDRVLATAVNAPPSRDDELTLVGTVPPPNITKTADLDPVQAGQILTYTLTVVNESTVNIVSNVTVVESYDPFFAYQSSTPAPVAGTENVWDLGDLPPGFTTNIVISGKVLKKALREDVLFNTAEVISRSGSRTVHLTTRVLNVPPIPVTLLFFRAVEGNAGVKVKWETATEFENLGFNVYRATSLSGNRTKLNAGLIAGADSSDGAAYKFMDTQAKPGKTYYYWLEEVAWNLKTTLYGPCVRQGGAVAAVDAPAGSGSLAGFTTTPKGGLYRITCDVLKASGIAVATVDPEKLVVRINGQQTPLYVCAEGPGLRPDDFVLFYAPGSEDGLACEVAVEDHAARMAMVDVRPGHKAGDVYLDQAGKNQRLRFVTDESVVRYFLQDFTGTPVWLVDCTDPAKPIMLIGQSYVVLENGLTAVYLSYDTGSVPAKCLAVQDDAVVDVPAVNRVKR